LNQEQSKRLGQLLSMGIPLPIAYAIALDPEQAQAGLAAGTELFVTGANTALDAIAEPKKAKRKVSAYNRRYKAAFKKIAPKHKGKNGKWKTGGFKRAVKAAHKEAKK